MPQRFVYRGAGGRFISRALAEEQGIEPTPVGPFLPSDQPVPGRQAELVEPEPEPEPEPFEQTEWERGYVWQNFDDDRVKEGLGNLRPPEDVNAYRVFVNVEKDPDYPRGMASTGWIGIEAWNPTLDMIAGVTGASFNQIRFRRA